MTVDECPSINRGSIIRLFIKDEQIEYLEKKKINDIVSGNDELAFCYDSIFVKNELDFLKFYSTKPGEEMTLLKDYIARMPENQKDI